MLASLLVLSRLIDARAEPHQPARNNALKSPVRQSTASLLLRAAGTGVFLACAVLIRPGFILWLAPAGLAIIWFVKSSMFARGLYAAMMLAAFGLVLLPWAIRNHNVTGHWVITSLWSGPSLYDGLNPNADGTSDMTFFDDENVLAEMSEYDMNAHYQQRALEFVRANPGRSAELAIRKSARFLQPAPSTPPLTWGIWVACGTFYMVFMGLCLSGIGTRHMDLRSLLVCTGPFLLFLGVHMVFVGSLRYRLPTEFPLAIVAAAGLRSWPLQRRDSEAQVAD